MTAVIYVVVGFVVGYAVHYFSKGQTKKEIEAKLDSVSKEIKDHVSAKSGS